MCRVIMVAWLGEWTSCTEADGTATRKALDWKSVTRLEVSGAGGGCHRGSVS